MKMKMFLAVGSVIFLSGCAVLDQQAPVKLNTENPAETGASVSETEVVKNRLNLSGQNLKKVPEYVFSETGLQELDLSDNQLTGAIQAEIRQLKNLKILDASDNLMTGVPAEIGQLQNLQVLDLSNNQLTGLPLELGNLKNLQTLDLSGNDYSEYDLGLIEQSLPRGVNIIK